MPNAQTDLLTEELLQLGSVPRKSLLPLWIKIVAWIFAVFTAMVPVVIVMGMMGYKAQLSMYGLETYEPFSWIGLLITIVFAIKGFTAYGLLKEKDWAINMGLADAVIGILLCTLIMLYPLIEGNTSITFRLELIVLIIYLRKLLSIKTAWESSGKLVL